MRFYSDVLRWFARLMRQPTADCAGRAAAEYAVGADRDARLRLGYLLLGEGRIEDALVQFRAVDVSDGGGEATTEAFTSERLDIERARRGEPHSRWFDDVRIETAYWSVMRDGCVYNDDVHAKNLLTSPFVQGRASADGKIVIATLPPPAREIEQECVLVGGDQNYSHWLFRNMLKLSTLDRAGLLYTYPWLINSDLQKYQVEYLELLGQPPDRLIKVERNQVVACRRVLVPALHISERAVTLGVQWIRERFAHLLAEPGRAARRLFISRRDSERRSLFNEDEVFAALEPLGFERVLAGHMSVVEQIAAFSGARCIVAPHGAALTNMIFAPPGAAIVELTSSAIEHMNLFRKLARSTQQQIDTIVSDDYPADSGHAAANGAPAMHADYRVDVRQVRETVLRIL